MKRVVTDRLISACICLIAVGLGGCNLLKPKSGKAQDVAIAAAPAGTIAVSEMGDRLGLTVKRNSPHSATLGNRFNSVMFFVDPGGLAYVNGRKIGHEGGLVAVGETIYVPESLERKIRRAMRTEVVSRPPRRTPLKRSPPLGLKPQLTYGPVVIDAGHGGKDPGTSHHGLREKDIVLDAALMVEEVLRASGVDARMTRSGDTFVELDDRAAMAQAVGAKLFVSLHCDAAPNRRARGFTIYAPQSRMGQTSSFASVMEKSMLTTNMASRGIRAAGFRVLLRTRCPALLVEMGYLSNRYDARALGSKSSRRAIARAVANAVIDYLTK